VPSNCAVEDRRPREDRGLESDSVKPAATRYPTKSEVLAAIPKECFERSLFRSSLSLLVSLSLSLLAGGLAWAFLPLSWPWLPACVSLEKVGPGPNSPGDSLRYVFREGGRRKEMAGEIVGRIAGERLLCRYHDDAFEVTVDMRVAPSSPVHHRSNSPGRPAEDGTLVVG